MVQIAGKYEHVKSENVAANLQGLGIPEELAKKVEAASPSIEVVLEGSDKVILTTTYSAEHKSTYEVFLKKEFDEDIKQFNIKLKSTAKLVGNVLTITSTTQDGKVLTREHKFSDSELVVTQSVAGASFPESKRYYKRV